jgi:hypothetical protein
MTDLSRRLEQTLRAAIQKNPILPVKVEDGILVGDAKIVSDSHIKHIYFKGVLIYKDVSLNAVAIKLANILARRSSTIQADALYRADQEYGRWFTESQLLRTQYQRSINNKDFDRADMLWARYCESRDRALSSRNHAQSLAAF